MQLSIPERIQFDVCLYEEGNFIEMTLRQAIIEKVRVTQEEVAEIELKTDDGQTFSWNKEKAGDKEIDFTSAELELIKKKLRELDMQGKLTSLTTEFYKKFIS